MRQVTIEEWHGRPARSAHDYCPKQQVETGISKGKDARIKRQNEKRETRNGRIVQLERESNWKALKVCD